MTSSSDRSICWPTPLRSRWRSAARIAVEAYEAGQDVDHRHAGLAAVHRPAGRRGSPVMLIRPPIAWMIKIVAGAGAIGPGMAEAGDRAIDQPRIDRGEILPAEPVALERADLEILDQHVGLGGETAHEVGALGIREIDGDRALAAIGRPEIGRAVDQLARAAGEVRPHQARCRRPPPAARS